MLKILTNRFVLNYNYLLKYVKIETGVCFFWLIEDWFYVINISL